MVPSQRGTRLDFSFGGMFALKSKHGYGIDGKQVATYLAAKYTTATGTSKTLLGAILSSALFDTNGRIVYRVAPGSFCGASNGCLQVIVNPAMKTADPRYTPSKAAFDWNSAVRRCVVSHTGTDT